MLRCRVAVNFEPPVADQIDLTENRSVGTEKRDFAPFVANVENLKQDNKKPYEAR
jgi:hypothetical protein